MMSVGQWFCIHVGEPTTAFGSQTNMMFLQTHRIDSQPIVKFSETNCPSDRDASVVVFSRLKYFLPSHTTWIDRWWTSVKPLSRQKRSEVRISDPPFTLVVKVISLHLCLWTLYDSVPLKVLVKLPVPPPLMVGPSDSGAWAFHYTHTSNM